MVVKAEKNENTIGTTPSGWKVNPLSKIAPFQRGFDLPRCNLKAGINPVVYSNGIMNYHEKALVKSPGVITGRSGTIGKVFFLENDYWPHNTTLWVTDFKQNIPKFIYYLYEYIHLERFSTGSGVPTLNRNVVHDYTVAIPPINEQRAIADALSDVDALITSLDSLIAKKRAIKQGVMQELLIGKRRLSGFNKKWKREKVNQFGEIVTGGTPPTQNKEFWEGTVPWITPTDITKEKDIYHSEREITYLGLKSIRELPQNSILVTCIASIGKNSILRVKGACNQQINAIVPNRDHDPDFLYYLFEYNKNFLLGNAGITATLIISKKDFSDLTFLIPEITEQISIASILSDIDSEIISLEQKRDKTKALKQGMMQELLTGRIRLLEG